MRGDSPKARGDVYMTLKVMSYSFDFEKMYQLLRKKYQLLRKIHKNLHM